MKFKLRRILKKIFIMCICTLSLVTTVISAVPTAEARGSYDILNTNTALGSPILNERNFDSEDWNKWETICWGVFLSNFCQPLVDTYETAFKDNKGGSNGAGFSALWGGSGSDRANAKIIKALCEYAIDNQKSYSNEIYVCYSTEYTDTGSIKKAKPEEGKLRPATFQDLWLNVSKPECNCKDSCVGHTYMIYEKIGGWPNGLTFSGTTDTAYYSGHKETYAQVEKILIDNQIECSNLLTVQLTNEQYESIKDELKALGINSIEEFNITRDWYTWCIEYDDIVKMQEFSLPTFYIKNGSKYIEIWDYTDWWDIQVISAMSNSIRNEDIADQFKKNFETYWENNIRICMDPYGNIVTANVYEDKVEVAGTMIIPAAVNQHTTGEKSINTLNSWFLNSYVSTVDEDSAVLGLRQNLNTYWNDKDEFSQSKIMNGYPAFGKSNIGNIGMFYYDLDSIMVHSIRKNGTIMNYGDALLELFNLDITNERTSSVYPVKFEVAGNGFGGIKWWGNNGTKNNYENIMKNTGIGASIISNVAFEKGKTQKKILSTISLPYDNQKINLFRTSATAIAVKAKESTVKDEATEQGFLRQFYNYLYKSYIGKNSGSYTFSRDSINGAFAEKSWVDIASNKNGGNKTTLSNMLYKFSKYNSTYDKDKFRNQADSWEIFRDYGKNESFDQNTNRIVLAYLPSEAMVEAASVLGIKDGTEFSTYCTYIYMTYLDFYGVNSTKTLTEVSHTSNFNSEIYDIEGRKDSILIDNIGKELNDYGGTFEHTVDIEKEVLQYGYLMLSPTDGREYRKQMILDGIDDFIYEQYNKTVYGGTGKYSGTASKYKSGFLYIENYSDNFLTAWFLKYYVDIVIWAILIGILMIIIIGLIKGKKLSWFIVTSLIIINGILLVPSGSEIVPYFTSSVTQKMFKTKMTFWSISEGISNSSVEKDLIKAQEVYQTLSPEETAAIATIVQNLSTTQTDSSLCIKQDISQKVTQKLSDGAWKDIESYQSARWILPMVMQQFSANTDKESEEYIYKPLANIWDDMSNIYWYFNPSNAESIDSQSPTMTSGQTGDNVTSSDKDGDDFKLYKSLKDKYFTDVNLSKSQISTDIAYKSISYTLNTGDKSDIITNNERPKSQIAHLICYYLDSNIEGATLNPISRKEYTKNYVSLEHGSDSTWGNYINTSVNNTLPDNWNTSKQGGFEYTADSYIRDERSSITSDMPYLFSTESPTYYFYAVVKDSFKNSTDLGHLINELQGHTFRLEDGTILRDNFMYATKGTIVGGEVKVDNATHYVRDILDLEEMFCNMIPYMYQMQLTAGGFDGESGILVTEGENREALLISDELNYYDGTLQSWMYRCNWATKIMENPNFERETTVRDKDGNTYVVSNPLLWECYPEERPMVFSEAQKQAMGLDDRDLSIVELKCIEVNNKVAKQWTLLINYAGTPGITTEILMRQMATDATLTFSQVFSSSGLLDTTYQIYPQSIDLRYMSFDSIMKMLIMNVSKDTSYAYGDTMLNVISNSDTATGILLWIAAGIGAFLVPFARCILLAFLFYGGFIGIFRVILHDNKTKANVACGQLISNILFMAYTLIYFFCFYLMMNLTSSDEVLTVNNMRAEAGNPVWVILIVILVSGLYVFAMGMHLKFCWENRADMGFAAYSQIAGRIVSNVQGGFDNIRDNITNFFNKEDNTYSSKNNYSSLGDNFSGVDTTKTDGLSVEDVKKFKKLTEEVKSKTKSSVSGPVDNSADILDSTDGKAIESAESSGFSMEDTENILNTTSSNDINAEIEIGKSLE